MSRGFTASICAGQIVIKYQTFAITAPHLLAFPLLVDFAAHLAIARKGTFLLDDKFQTRYLGTSIDIEKLLRGRQKECRRRLGYMRSQNRGINRIATWSR